MAVCSLNLNKAHDRSVCKRNAFFNLFQLQASVGKENILAQRYQATSAATKPHESPLPKFIPANFASF